MNFDKWWPCLKKHTKRVKYLLPYAKYLKANLNSERAFRYFTLCAPPMIDVFMLTKEDVLDYDESHLAIDAVVFCEYNQEHVPMMRELIGRENSGFQGRLEDLVLFEDDDFTATLPDIRAVENYRIQKGESLTEEQSDQLQKKIDHLELQRCFPFDFINLDFCDHYYPDPPDIMKVNKTVDRMLEWQRRVHAANTSSKTARKVDEFMMAITCRHDTKLPAEAQTRLLNLIRSNCDEFPNYKQQLQASRPTEIDVWAESSNLDFFLAGWPKEIAHLADQRQWDMEIVEYLHYSRISDTGQSYEMICLVCVFKRTEFSKTYLAVSMKALDEDQRIIINRVDREDANGKALLSDLTGIVELRNAHAENAKRDVLPLPINAIEEFEGQGVQY
jgi:hypothetical protein